MMTSSNHIGAYTVWNNSSCHNPPRGSVTTWVISRGPAVSTVNNLVMTANLYQWKLITTIINSSKKMMSGVPIAVL